MRPTMGEVRLRARYVFPGTDRPLMGGVVTIRGERIVAVEHGVPGARVQDLGNVALLPGLINAHTHLELSDVEQPIGAAGGGFVAWIEELIRRRQGRSLSAEAVIAGGLAESVRQGVVAVADTVQPGWPPGAYCAAPIDTAAFLELIGPTAESVTAELELATGHLSQGIGAKILGLSPHAPHTVHDALLDAIATLAARSGTLLSMHLAESREEMQLLRWGTGPLRELLAARGRWEASRFTVPKRPLDYLKRLAQAGRALVVHGNYLDDEEIAFLGQHRAGLSVVYCPRSHAHFGHSPYPLAKMLAAGVRVALGTDSRASAPDLSVLAEMRAAARQHREVPGEAIVRMATLDAARALGWQHEMGSLEPGKLAHLTVVALPEGAETDPYALLLDGQTPVVGRWYRGRPEPATRWS